LTHNPVALEVSLARYTTDSLDILST